MNKLNNKTGYITQAAVIAALYAVITYALAPISYGAVQFRLSEALCVLAAFTPSAVPGLFVGCLVANVLGTAVPMDVIFGSLATLIGAAGTYALRKRKMLCLLPPILANTIIVPYVLAYAYGATDAIWFMMITVGIGEIVSVGIFGSILKLGLERYGHILYRL